MHAIDQELIRSLQAQSRSALSSVLEGSRTVVLLDFPYHQNVGDSMIWLGEVAHLKAMQIEIVYRADLRRVSLAAIKRLPADVAILLHGGGNFGDLWPKYQQFRENIVQAFPGRLVVQLPQSVWFQEQSHTAQTNARLASHGNFRLMVREHRSKAYCAEHLPDVEVSFCPDMAFGIGEIATVGNSPRSAEPVLLLRGDHEAVGSRNSSSLAEPIGQAQDWGLRGSDRLWWHLSRVPLAVSRVADRGNRRPLSERAQRSYDRLAQLNLKSGTVTFSPAPFIATDRLHAHVLACLMGKRNFVLDNAYGKNSSVFEAYSGEFTTTTFCRSRLDLLEQLPARVVDGEN